MDRVLIPRKQDCLAANQKKDVLLDLADHQRPPGPGEKRRRSVGIDERATFTCAKCTTNPKCFVCYNAKLPTAKQDQQQDVKAVTNDDVAENDTNMDVDVEEGSKPEINEDDAEGDEEGQGDGTLLFRCHRCKQACHYAHSE